MSFPLKGKTPVFNAGYVSSRQYAAGNVDDSPNISIVVSPFSPPLIPLELTGISLSSLLRTVSVAKARNQPGGTFYFELAADDKKIKNSTFALDPWRGFAADLRKIFHPMTMVQLWWDGLHVMTGYVRTCRRRWSDQAGEKVYSISCDELGCLYDENVITKQLRYWGLNTNILRNTWRDMETKTGTLVGVPLPQAVNLLAQAFIKSTLQYFFKFVPVPFWRASDGLPMAYRLVNQPPPLGCISSQSIIQTLTANTTLIDRAGGASFWDYLKQLAPEPFVELTTETGGRSICTGRVIPFGADVSLVSRTVRTVIPGAQTASNLKSGISITPMLPGFCYMILRTSPYDNPLLGATAFKQMFPFTLGVMDLLAAGDFVIAADGWNVRSKDLGLSDVQQKTAWQVNLSGGAASNDGTSWGFPPSYSAGPQPFGTVGLSSLAPGGLKTFPTRISSHSLDATSLDFQGVLAQNLAATRARYDGLNGTLPLSNWLNVCFRNEHNFNQGTMVMRATPQARPGMILLYLKPKTGEAENEADLGSYYIDNVQHEFSVGAAPTTTLSLTRGTPIPLSGAELGRHMTEWETHDPAFGFTDEPA